MLNISQFNDPTMTVAAASADAANKAQAESQKMFFSFVDGMQKQMQLRDKYNSYKVQMGTLADFTKTGMQAVGQVKKWQAADKAWNEFWTFDENDPTYQKWLKNEAEADEVKANLETAGEKARLKGDPFLAKKLFEGGEGRAHTRTKVQGMSNHYKAALIRAGKTWPITLPSGEEKTLEQMSDEDDIKYAIGRIRHAFIAQLVGEDGEVNPNMIRKYAFRKMHEIEKNFLNGKREELLKTLDASETDKRDTQLAEGMEAGGAGYFIDWMKSYEGVLNGGDEDINNSFVREQAFAKVAQLVTSGKIPLSVAEPLLRHEFKGWDGTTKMVYDDGKRKPYWKEAKVLLEAIEKKKKADVQRREDNRNTNNKIVEQSILDEVDKEAENGPIPPQFRLDKIKQYMEETNSNTIPESLSGILIAGEENQAQVKFDLQENYKKGLPITKHDLGRITDFETWKYVKDNLMSGNISQEDHDQLELWAKALTKGRVGDQLEAEGTEFYMSVHTGASAALIQNYRDQMKIAPNQPEKWLGNAYSLTKQQVDNGDFDKLTAVPYNKTTQSNFQKAGRSIVNNPTASATNLLEGMESNAEALYNWYLTPEHRREKSLASLLQPYQELKKQAGGSIIGNVEKFARNQANIYGIINDKDPLDEVKPSRLEEILKNKPAMVSQLLEQKNNGSGSIRAFGHLAETDSQSEVLQGLYRPEAKNHGGLNALLTNNGWESSETVLGKNLDKHTYEEILGLDWSNISGIGNYATSKTQLQELLELAGVPLTEKPSEFTEMKLAYARLRLKAEVKGQLCGVLNNWRQIGVPKNVRENMAKVLFDMNADHNLLAACRSK